jgi:uncharacterized protein (UPF0261 family)
MLVLMFCAALVAIVTFPDTLVGKGLRRLLIDLPARMLSRLTPGRIAMGLVVMGAAALVAILFEAEGLRLLGMAIPEGLVWVAAFDIATFIDLFAAVAMVVAAARLRGLRDSARAIVAWTRSRVSRIVMRRTGRSRQRRARRPASRPVQNDDGEGWVLAFA